MDPIDRRIVIVANVAVVAAILLSSFLLAYSIVSRKYQANPLYAAVPAAFIALLLLSLRLKPSNRVNVVLMIVVTGFVVYGAEIVLGYVEMYRHCGSFIRRKHEKLDLIERMRNSGDTVYPIFSSSEHILLLPARSVAST